MAAAPDLKILGRYRIDRVLGKGAMGVVYEGFDPRLNRRVAIKTILKSHLEEDTAKDYSQRFVREAQAVARLNHPNIVQVHDFGEEGDMAYLVMEFIQGKELKTYFDAKERFEVKEAVRIMGELCNALEFAHNAGIIHRDVKPGNVMIDSHARAKLTDFGVARVQDVTRSQATGTMVGTPAFMSPEQISGGNVDRRTDVFSAGIIVYQFLTGDMPFTGSGAWTIAKKIMQDEPPWPSSLNTSVTPLFDAVVNKALAKNQNDRFQSARDLAIALTRALDGKPEEDGSDKTIVGSITNEVAPSRPPLPKPPTPQATKGGAAVSTHGSQEVELEFWRAIKDGNDPDDFELYVQQFPNGVYAALAKRKVAKLRGFETATLPLAKDAQREIDEAEFQARAEAEEKTRREAEESERRARWEAEEKRRTKWEAEEKASREAEAKAKREAEEKAKREAKEKTRREAEAKAKREVEERAKAEAEARARREAEAKARRESEERAAREAERRARAEAEAKPSASLRVEPPRPEPTRPASRNVAPFIAIGLGVVIAAGAGLYFAFSGTKSPPAESKAPSIEPSKAKAAGQEAAAKAAQEKAQHDKAEANRVAVEHAREKAEADKAAGEKVKAAEIAAAEKAAREKAKATESAAAEKAAREKAKAIEIAAAEKATAVRAADEKERQEWEAIKASANPRDFDKFLAARPTGKYSDQARASLAKLHDDDRRRQQAAIEEERKQMRAKMEEERKQNQAKIEEERRRLAQEQQRLQEAREREEQAAREKQGAAPRRPAFVAPTF